MIDVIMLRLDAPLVAFGGVMVDSRGFTARFPGRSAVAGLVGNALGYDHRDAALLARLQERLVIASRADRVGVPLRDYQTVDLGQPFLRAGWTTRGRTEERGGASGDTTHIRERDYLADALYTVALALEPAGEAPTLDDIARALEAPERPLFIGRKACLPSSPIFAGRARADSVRAALDAWPRALRTRRDAADEGPLPAQWPDDGDDGAQLLAVTDDRDWENQIHVGKRFVREGTVSPPAAPAGGERAVSDEGGS